MGILKKLNSLIGNLLITVALFCLTGELHSEPTSADLSYLKIIKNGLLREGPASYYKIAENLEIGTIVQAFEKHDDWYLIKTHSGRIGWITASDVTPQVQSQDLMAKTNLQNGSPPNIDQK
ncbi:MAG TPA: SH3 domain-containing protein, partial [Candidatus Marinimicrobia bacterium]|nr:SH3 domain-containing protein [Candidatus Neomarinimicrobiota bacterium]